MRYAARRDNNSSEMIAALKLAGFGVVDYSRAGLGIPDLLATRPLPQGHLFICWLEVKSDKGRLSQSQLPARSVWEPRGEWLLARDVEETLAALNTLFLAKLPKESGSN